VPQFSRLRPAAWARRISARHLLTHSAGLANPIPIRWIHDAGGPPVDQDELLDRLLARHGRLRFGPGTRASYSNLGFLGLGVVVAQLAGAAFPDVIEQELLRPLRMHRSGFAYTGEMARRAATGYHPRLSPLRLLVPRWAVGRPAGHWVSLRPFLLDGQAYGGLVGSLEDAARFLRMHVSDGDLDGTRVLTPESSRSMQQIVVRGGRRDLGLGWFRPADHRTADPPFVEHLGGGAGFFNVLRIHPTLGVGIAVMGNATRYGIDAVARLALTEPARTQ
jgi:CubicO group peptidase (beta-lactamase class C family)